MNSFRSFLYTLVKLMGDYQAIKKNRVGRWIGRRLAGKAAGRGLGKPFR
jgi:hypothetical protein